MLTVDLTNRCNMMCDPCFMDANQVGFVHELEWDEVQKILDDSLEHQAAPADERAVLGRRADALAALPARGALREGQSASSACSARPTASASRRSRTSRGAAKDAGLRLAYLQFDGVGEEANAHRKVGNLFDVKLRAIENLHAAGIDVVLVVTVVRGRQRRPGRPRGALRDRERRQDHRRVASSR